jgi:hypothetical protein
MDNEQKDEYTLKLEEKKEIVQKCQEAKGLQSCLNCETLFECETRKEYVLAVYESMNKGQSGGFEF